jgi:hypothetical protein
MRYYANVLAPTQMVFLPEKGQLDLGISEIHLPVNATVGDWYPQSCIPIGRGN